VDSAPEARLWWQEYAAYDPGCLEETDGDKQAIQIDAGSALDMLLPKTKGITLRARKEVELFWFLVTSIRNFFQKFNFYTR
jgi:hypothetical protein